MCVYHHRSMSFLEAMTTRAADTQPESTTKNTRGNRKVVTVTYAAPTAVFKIPDGLDLEDKTVVNMWYVKYGTLHIHYTDGREEEIEWEDDLYENDYKRGVDGSMGDIEDADVYGVDYSEDEDDDDA